jgi:hypothetical protein
MYFDEPVDDYFRWNKANFRMLKKAFLLSFNRYCRTINYPDLYNSGAGSGRGVRAFIAVILFTLTHGPPVVPCWETRKLMAHYLPLRIQFLQVPQPRRRLSFFNSFHAVNGSTVNLSGLKVTVDKRRCNVTSVFASSMEQKTRDFKPTQFLKDFTNSRFLRETCSCRLASLKLFSSLMCEKQAHSERNHSRGNAMENRASLVILATWLLHSAKTHSEVKLSSATATIHDRVARSCIVSPRLSSLS